MKDNTIKILEALKSNRVYGKNVEETVVLYAGNELIKDINWIEMKSILSKLHNKKIIKIVSLPYNSDTFNSGVNPEKDKDKLNRRYKIKLLKGFDDYIQKYLDVPNKDDNQVCLWISYPDTGEVLLNDIIILATPIFSRTNDLVFKYLFDNPNKLITKNELEREASKETIPKSMHDIVRELGFEKELRTIFFKATKTTIIFRNPITKQHLIDLGHPKFRL